MALYKVIVRKAINDAGGVAKWSNAWYVETLSSLTAAVTGVQIWDEGERQFHKSRVFCYEIYASSVLAGDTDYVVYPYNGFTPSGAIASAGDQLPLFNVVRVDIQVASGGRPSRKFFRPTLEEGDQTNGNLTNTTLVAAINAGMEDIVAIAGVKDEDGNAFSGATIRGVTSRRLGKYAGNAVPPAPTV